MIRTKIFIAASLIPLVAPSTALALSSKQRQQMLYRSTYYDGKATVCASGGDVNLVGNDNPEKIYNFFMGQGLSAEQASGIMGNMWRESTFVPDRSERSGGGGYGLIQWTGGRRTQLEKYAQQQGKPVGDLSLQLEYLVKESKERQSRDYPSIKEWDGLLKQTTVRDATIYWEHNSERAGVVVIEQRIDFANKIYAKFGGSAGTAANQNPSEVPDETALDNNSCGGASQFIDGFTVYSQGDPAWGSKPYGDSTIKQAGCGPTAMTMIITALTGNKVLPDETAAYATSAGMFVKGQGSSWTIGKVLAEHWGLKAEPIGADMIKITQTLQNGGLVLAGGAGPLPFTTNGHYIVIRGITADGKFKVGDPGHRASNDKDWDAEALVSAIRTSNHEGTVYAITK